MKRIFLILVCLIAISVNAQDVKPVKELVVLKYDTVYVSGTNSVKVFEKESKSGEMRVYAKYGGKGINISQKDGEGILEGGDPAIVFRYWNDGQIEAWKVIDANRKGK